MPRARASWALMPRFWSGFSASSKAAVLLAPDFCWLRRDSSTWPGVRLCGGTVAAVVVGPEPVVGPPGLVVAEPGAVDGDGAGRILVWLAGGVAVVATVVAVV